MWNFNFQNQDAYPPIAGNMANWGNAGSGLTLSQPNMLSTPMLPSIPNGVTPPATTGGGFWDGMIGTREAPGWGGMALGAGSALMNGFLGLQQYNLAKDTFRENKRQFNMNWDAQKKTTNSALEDRQRARLASNSGAYQSVDDYMRENGI